MVFSKIDLNSLASVLFLIEYLAIVSMASFWFVIKKFYTQSVMINNIYND